MKWILLFATSLIAGACNTTLPLPATETSEAIEISDSTEMACIYNDSIDNILMHPANVTLYKMCSLVRDSTMASQKDSLFNYPIDAKIGKLKTKEKILLDFIIQDKKLYRKNYPQIRQPFNPDFALVFSQGKQSVFYFTSFGTGEIAIADTNGNFRFYLMNDARPVKRWYNYVLSLRTKKNKKA